MHNIKAFNTLYPRQIVTLIDFQEAMKQLRLNLVAIQNSKTMASRQLRKYKKKKNPKNKDIL